MSRAWYFSGGETGDFKIQATHVVRGESLPNASWLSVAQVPPSAGTLVAYTLVGVTSNERYVTRPEKSGLVAAQQALGRTQAIHGAFIPIKKSDEWWALPQDERRKIFEDDSKHIAIGMKALPAVARRLHHCRDLGESQPFDFLTWFDFAPESTSQFDDLLGALRSTEEWRYVVREVELRVLRNAEG